MSTLLVAVPLLGVLAVNLPLPGLRRTQTALAVGLLVCLWQAGVAVGASAEALAAPSGWLAPLLQTRAPVDSLARVMFLTIGLVGAAALAVGRGTIDDDRSRRSFVNLVILAVAGMNGMVLAADLFSLYVFLEVTAVASFVLICLDRTRDAFEGAFKYVVLSAVATTMILAAMGILLMTRGSVALGAAGNVLDQVANRPLLLVAAGLLLAGLSIKSGLVPFHGWLPDAYSSAPPATSVLLAGVVTKTTGVYALIRVVTGMFPSDTRVQALLLAVGILSVLAGALAALPQSDMKRMLAYSSISQVGYIVLGLGAGSAIGLAGAVFHLFNHAVFKSLLFANAAAVEQRAGTRDMDRLGGLAARMPVTGGTSAVAFLSTAGIPPLSGFWSKLLIVVALWQAGHTVYAALAIGASVLTLAYFLSMQRRVFFGKLAAGFEGLREADGWTIAVACGLAAITVAVGLLAPWAFGTFLLPIRSIL